MKILHLNIEKDKHLDAIHNLIQKEDPDVLALCEIYNDTADTWGETFGYHVTFSGLYKTKDGRIEGSALLSKEKPTFVKDYRYVDGLEELPFSSGGVLPDGTRPKERWKYHNSLNTVVVDGITIATTHFPVVDHMRTDRNGHEMGQMSDIDDIHRAEDAGDRLIEIVRSIEGSLVFTADLNNPRGENIYDTLAHELVDLVPEDLESSLDPELHRVKGLDLMVDAFMISQDLKGEKVRVVEGVSDHKAFIGNISR